MTALDALTQRLDELEKEQSRIRKDLANAEQARIGAEQARDQYKTLYLELMERCRKLERGLLGQKSEHLGKDDQQLSFAVLQMALGNPAAAALTTPESEVKPHKRRKPTGRNPIPEHLPRIDIEVLPLEVQEHGLSAFERIGEEVTEIIERRPASLVVARVIKGKFVRKDRVRNGKTDVFVGETPALPIARCLAGPGMLADTIVRRWQDHQPLNRLEGIYARDGMPLARSTMCGWHDQLTPLVQPLVAAMRQDAFEQPYLCTDATGVLVQAKDKCRHGHFWVLVAPERHVLFEFSRKHDSDAVDDLLAGYEGYLVADAHTVYDHLYVGGTVTEVNCWAHARRYYFKSMSSDPERAKVALGHIGALFRIERSIATAPRKKRERIRKKQSKPIVSAFFSWCDEQWPTLLENTPIYDGVRYCRNQREGLQRFLDDGRLPLHNNISELNLRRQAIGRKNWLFVGSDDGAAANAAFTSLLASSRMHNVEPWAYLRDIFCLLPQWPEHRLLELAPLNWQQTSAREDVTALLAANPYRQITLLQTAAP
ncbi:MAG TPA: IS66 family transposase [Polyangiaceae bacterium]|nr:IS66 family transposase [Polyangiaceae bacterium]HMR77202.1 IS66 family transposase [Polyangiaceae bacterium]